MPLSVESLTLEVGKALAPLEQRLRGGEIVLLFAEIGLPAPQVVLGGQAVRDAIASAATALSGLPRTLTDLADAIDSREAARIGQALAATASILKAVIEAVEVVSGAIRAAAVSAGPGQAEVTAFAGEFAQRLFGFALATYLEEQHPVAGHLLGIIGVIESAQLAATPHTPAHTRRLLRVDRLTQLVRDPVGLLGELYRWGAPDFDWDELLRRLSVFLSEVTNFAFLQTNTDPAQSPFLRIFGVDIDRTADAVPGIQAALRLAAGDKFELNVPIGDTAAFIVTADATLEGGAAIQLLPCAPPPARTWNGTASSGAPTVRWCSSSPSTAARWC